MATAVEDLNNINLYDDVIFPDKRFKEIERLCKFLQKFENYSEFLPWALIDVFEIMLRVEELVNYYNIDEFYL